MSKNIRRSGSFKTTLLTLLVVLLASFNIVSPQDHDGSALFADLQDRDWRVRRAAVRQLGELDPPNKEIVAQLDAALEDGDSRVRRSAATALGRIGPDAARATPSLIRRLQDDDPEVTLSAVRTLGQIGRRASRAARHLRPLLLNLDSSRLDRRVLTFLRRRGWLRSTYRPIADAGTPENALEIPSRLVLNLD